MSATRELVQKILESAECYYPQWSIQGFGMLRLYLAPEVRLHVWTDVGKVEGVSTIHDHPWDFSSEVVVGRVENVVYREVAPSGDPTHDFAYITCGERAAVNGQPMPTWLAVDSIQVLDEANPVTDQSYRQGKNMIHETRAVPGTVTICRRVFRGNPDIARVFWPHGQQWVNAAPRPATREKIRIVASQALGLLGKDVP